MAAKTKAAKGGLKLGRRRAERTPAGTAVLYTQALAGDADARRELRRAFESARKAYGRAADRGGRPRLTALVEDRKAQRETSRAVESLRRALRLAERRRKPRSVRGPVLVAVVVAGAGVAASSENVRAKAAAVLGGGEGSASEEAATPNAA